MDYSEMAAAIETEIAEMEKQAEAMRDLVAAYNRGDMMFKSKWSLARNRPLMPVQTMQTICSNYSDADIVLCVEGETSYFADFEGPENLPEHVRAEFLSIGRVLYGTREAARQFVEHAQRD